MVSEAPDGPARSPARAALETCAARSYLSDGTGVGWRVQGPEGWRVAVDAEWCGQQVPPNVGRLADLEGLGSGDEVLAAWTRAEVLAKLTHQPILLRLKQFGLSLRDLDEREPVALRTHVHDGVVVTVGTHRPHGG